MNKENDKNLRVNYQLKTFYCNGIYYKYIPFYYSIVINKEVLKWYMK